MNINLKYDILKTYRNNEKYFNNILIRVIQKILRYNDIIISYKLVEYYFENNFKIINYLIQNNLIYSEIEYKHILINSLNNTINNKTSLKMLTDNKKLNNNFKLI